jgi:hypothetical protein
MYASFAAKKAGYAIAMARAMNECLFLPAICTIFSLDHRI